MRLLALLYLILMGHAICLAQLGNNILVGSKMLFKFGDSSLTIETLNSDHVSFSNQKNLSDCNGNLLGDTYGYIYKNKSFIISKNRLEGRTNPYGNYSLCSQIGTSFGLYNFSSTLEPNLSHSLFYKWNSARDSIFYNYDHWSFRNDSVIYAQSNCNIISDTLKQLPYGMRDFSKEIIKNDAKVWHIYPYRNSLIAIEIDEINKEITHYKKTTTQGNSLVKGPFNGLRTYSCLRVNNAGDYIARAEDAGSNAFNLYSFDKSTGELIYEKPLLTKAQLPSYGVCNYAEFSYPSILDGIAFSENDSLIYVAYTYSPVCNVLTQDYKKMVRIIYQIDRHANNPPSTARVVFSKYYNNLDDGSSNYFSKQTIMFTGPDGIIYYGMGHDNAISTIENANVYGGEIHTYNKYSVSGHLNIPGASLSPNTLKRASFDAFSNCADSTLAVFYGSDDLLRVAYHWGDGDSAVYDSGTMYNGMQTRHRYDSSGVYTITQKSLFNNCGYSKTKSKAINVLLPPAHTGMRLTADTACTSHTITLTDTLGYTQSVQIDWGDGAYDTLELATVGKSAISIAHTYTSSDTFALRYRLIGYGIPSEGLDGCERQVDSNYVATFHPTSLAAYSWTTNYTKDAALQDTILLCVDEGLTLTQSNDSISYFTRNNTSGNDTSVNDSLQLNLASGWYETILRGYTVHGCETKDTLTIGIAPRSTALWIGDTTTCQNEIAMQGIKANSLLGTIDSLTYDESVPLFQSADSLSIPFSSATGGTYTIAAIVYTNIGCIDTFRRKITVYTTPQLALTGDSLGCINNATTYIPTIVSADSTLLSWYVDGTLINTTSALPQNEHIAFVNSTSIAGVQQVAAIASTTYGCSAADTIYTTIQNPPNVQHSLTELAVCKNQQPIEINATIRTADSSTVTHTWDTNTADTTFIDTSIAKTLLHTYLSAGSYTLKTVVTTAQSLCSDTAYTTITVHPQPKVTLASTDACENMQAEIVTTWSADTFISFVKTYNNNTLLNEVNSPNTSGSSSIYFTALQDENTLLSIARDTLGCRDTATITTSTLPLPKASYSAQYLSANGLEVDYLFTDKSTNHTSAKLFYGDGISTVEVPGFAQPYTYADSGTYTSYLIAANQNICFDTASIQVLAYPFVDFYFPNSITPNGDGLNDYLSFSTLFVQELTIDIYSRWGEQILQVTSPAELIKTSDLPQGIYLATYRIKDTFGKYHNIKQTLTVIR